MGKEYFWTSSFIICEDNMWFVPHSYNVLCCYNLKQKKYVKTVKLPSEKEYYGLYADLVSDGSKIYLIPRNATKMRVYDTNTEMIESIDIGDNSSNGYGAGVAIDRNIYLFPINTKMIVKYHMDNRVKEYIKFPECNSTVWNTIISKDGSYIYAYGNKNEILRFNSESDKANIIKCSLSDECISLMHVNNEVIYLIDSNGNFLTVDSDGLLVEKITNNISIKSEFVDAFCSYAFINNQIIVFPNKSDKIISYDISSKKIDEVKCDELLRGIEKYHEAWKIKFSTSKLWNGKIVLVGIYSLKIYLVDINSGKIEEQDLLSNELSDKDIKQMFKELIDDKKIVQENDSIYSRLEQLIKYVIEN